MQTSVHSRAGLVVLICALLIAFVAAAPVPSNSQQIRTSYVQVPGHGVHDVVPIEQSRSINGIPSSNAVGAGISKFTPELITHDKRETVTLVRRSIWTKIKEGFQRMAHGIKHLAQKIGAGIKHVAQKIGAGIKHVAQKIGSGIKHVAQKVGQGIKHVAQKIGHGLKVAAHAVGHFIKTTGAKIAKFGLKVIATVQKVAAKVIGFIPGVGKIIGKALEAVSTGLNKASDKIHVSLGAKLDKGMAVMDKARKIMGYIPRRRDLSGLDAFEERDLDYGAYLESREWIYEDLDVRDSRLDSAPYERGWGDSLDTLDWY